MTIGNRNVGDFCWINIMTPEPAKACEFFGALLGWTTPEMPGMGYHVQVGGRNIGGLFDVVSPRTPNGMPPMIGVMVKVASADATEEKVRALGGTSKPAFDIPGAGRMSVCFDPNGAEFDAWEPHNLKGTDVDSMLHGAPTWFETLTTDANRATEFYSKLFGWNIELMPMPDVSYSYIKLGDNPIGGIMEMDAAMRAAMKPHWGVYFAVNNADDAASNAVRLGGSVCIPVRPIPGVGRFCGLISPQGVMFYGIEYAAK